jgi:hypothetical protein
VCLVNTNSEEEDGDTGFDGHVGQDVERLACPPHLSLVRRRCPTTGYGCTVGTYLHRLWIVFLRNVRMMFPSAISNTRNLICTKNNKEYLVCISKFE